MLPLIITGGLIILLVTKIQISDRICDESIERIIYSDEEFSNELSSAKTNEDKNLKTDRMSSETFTKEFNENDYSTRSEEEAEELLRAVYEGGGHHK